MKIKIFAFLLLFSTQAFSFDLTYFTNKLNELGELSLFEDDKEFEVEDAERLFAFVEVLYLDNNGILQSHYHNYDFDMFYQGKNVFIRPFDSYMYNLYIQKSYARSWHHFIGQHESLAKTVQLLLSQYKDVSKRLTKAYESKKALQEKYQTYYGDEDYLKPIEDDIKHLSQLGWQLTIISRRFHDAIRPLLINKEMAQDRGKAHLDIVGGLDTFNEHIGYAEYYTEHAVGSAVEATIENVSNAVYALEQLQLQ